MDILLFVCAALAAVSYSNIYLQSIEKRDGRNYAHVKIQSGNTRHEVALMSNKDAKDLEKWKVVEKFRAETNDFFHTMPERILKKTYYAFRLAEGNIVYFTKPMYYSSNERWLDNPDEIAADKNGLEDGILQIAGYTILCLLHL